MREQRVLLVDDHPGFRSAATDFLTRGGWHVATAGSGEEALQALADGRADPHVILVDLCLPGLDGVEVALRIAALPDPPAVILISSQADSAADPRVRHAEARGFLPKQDLTWALIASLLA